MTKATSLLQASRGQFSPEAPGWWEDPQWVAFAAAVDLRLESLVRVDAPRFGPAVEPVRPPSGAAVPELSPRETPEPDPQTEAALYPPESEAVVLPLHQTAVDRAAIERDQLRREVVSLKEQIPVLRAERDRLRGELVELARQVPELRASRDDLLVTVSSLRAETADLEVRQATATALVAEIADLKQRRADLDRETIASLRRSLTSSDDPTSSRNTGRNRRRFDDG